MIGQAKAKYFGRGGVSVSSSLSPTAWVKFYLAGREDDPTKYKTIAYELPGLGSTLEKSRKPGPAGEGQVEYEVRSHRWGTRFSQAIPKSGPEDVRGSGMDH